MRLTWRHEPWGSWLGPPDRSRQAWPPAEPTAASPSGADGPVASCPSGPAAGALLDHASSPRSLGPSQVLATRHYETLDALRGVAAVAVLLLHTGQLLWPGLAESAYLAVDFFFVLSGFVVAHAYDAKLASGLPVARFVKLRMVRLYPLYLTGLLIGAAFLWADMWAGDGSGPLSASQIGLGLALGSLFLPAPLDGSPHLFALNIPAWSLFFEVLANLAYGVTHRWLSRPVLMAVVVLAGLALCMRATAAGSLDVGVRWTHLWGGCSRVFFSFPLGVLLYRHRAAIPSRLGALGSWPLLAALFLLCLPTVPEPWRALYDLGFVIAVSPLLVMAGTQAQPSAAARPVFLILGVISFPLYALHVPLRGWMMAAAERLGLEPSAAGLVYIAGILAIAWLVAPLDAAVRRRLLGRSRQPVDGGPQDAVPRLGREA